jgi:hypothetical protein
MVRLRHSWDMRSLAIAFCVLVCACLELPPAIDTASVAPSSQEGAPTPAPVAKTTTPAGEAAPKQAKNCPLATGRHSFCEGRRVCSRDHNGCEKCSCNAEHDASRAEFEHTNPWDMRQR